MNTATAMKKTYKITDSVCHCDGDAGPNTHVFDDEAQARAFVKGRFNQWMDELGIGVSDDDLTEDIWENYGVKATFRDDDEYSCELNIWIDDGTELPGDIRCLLDFDFREESQAFARECADPGEGV